MSVQVLPLDHFFIFANSAEVIHLNLFSVLKAKSCEAPKKHLKVYNRYH